MTCINYNYNTCTESAHAPQQTYMCMVHVCSMVQLCTGAIRTFLVDWEVYICRRSELSDLLHHSPVNDAADTDTCVFTLLGLVCVSYLNHRELHTEETSRTMNLLMSSSVGSESMLKCVGVSVGVSVEDETRVGVGNRSLV